MKLRPLSVSEVNQYIKKTFDFEPILNNVVVEGEISNYTLHGSGHSYFTLKDENSKLSCVLFKRDYEYIGKKLVNGQKVQAIGKISVYERDGRYQLYVKDIKLSGIGDLYVKFEKLKETLKREGLFEIKHKQNIPEFPKKVAVITSPTGAAVRDIINVITRRSSTTDIMVIPVRVQGEFSKVEIAHALELANTIKGIDLIILGRGGGSIEELWSFNEEIVARAIFDSRIPVISAVGHETDYTISDFVSDLRAPTPSSAAELAVKDEKSLVNILDTQYKMLINAQMKSIGAYKHILNTIAVDKLSNKFISKLNSKAEDIDYFYNSLNKSIKHKLSINAKTLSNIGDLLNAVNPLSIMDKGYSLVYNGDQKIVKSTEDTKVDDLIDVRLKDGTLNCTINKISKEEQNASKKK
ncbi:MAG: exodeoxyribonuclease VII large subunit [Acidaminobacteraceae bacterium]